MPDLCIGRRLNVAHSTHTIRGRLRCRPLLLGFAAAGWLSACGAGSTDAGPAAAAAIAPPVAVSPAPAAPASLVATPVGLQSLNPTSETITLVWNATSGVSGYKVYRDGALVWTSPAWTSTSGPSAATTYVDAGLSPDTSYVHTVTAWNSRGESAPSTGSSRTTTSIEPPGARVGYRFPTNQRRWDEFLESRDGSMAFPFFDADPVHGADVYAADHISPFIGPNLQRAHARNRGLKVIGHISGSHTAPGGIAAIEAKVDAWYRAFPAIDGIYVGDAGYAGPTGDTVARQQFVEYWAQIAAYIHSRGGLAFIHGGLPDDQPEFSAAVQSDLEANNRQLLRYYETIAIYETEWDRQPFPALYPWMTARSAGEYAYDFRFRYEVFANNINGSLIVPVSDYLLGKNAGYMYLTNVDLDRSVNDGSLDPRDDSRYWACENALLGLAHPTLCDALP